MEKRRLGNGNKNTVKKLSDYSKQEILMTLCATLLVAGSIFAYSLSEKTSYKNEELAQIMQVETGLLKEWQQSRGLRSTLAYGSTGSEVVLLQRMLSQDSSLYGDGKITGYYGDLTARGVRKFQEEYSLTQTGRVDSATRDKLNEVFLSHLCPEQTVIYPDFSLRKVTKERNLPDDYVPSSLQSISGKVKTAGIACVNKDTAENLIQMFKDAEKDGIHLAVTSGYRGPDIQKYLFNFWMKLEGASVLDEIAKPGASEHQLGTTVDLTGESIGYIGAHDGFAGSKEGNWMEENGYKYGFVMSYPRFKEKATGYKYEPWHWRFVGVDLAKKLKEKNRTFNESSQSAEKPFARSVNAGLNISSSAAISVFIDSDGVEHALLAKNKDDKLPIASVTKLMTALVAFDLFKPEDIIAVDEVVLSGKGNSGQYVAGDSFLFRDAVHAMLIGSHNEMAKAFAGNVGQELFVQKMNDKAKELGMKNTKFFNPTGLDPEPGSEEINYSTASDIAKLLRYIFENRDDIFSVLRKSEYSFQNTSGEREIIVVTTNELLKTRDTTLSVLGGKTGETPIAKMNLAIVSSAPSKGRIINVVIGANNSFDDMRKLLEYVNESFVW